ncbi:hypothetical protein ACFLYT_00195 [Nanoarchaeota archaeon]
MNEETILTFFQNYMYLVFILVFILVIASTIYLFINKLSKLKKEYGLQSYSLTQERIKIVKSDYDSLINRIKKSMKSLEMNIFSEDKWAIKAKTSATGHSWGEKVLIEIKDLKNGSFEVKCTSKPKLILNIVSIENVVKNVEQFMKDLPSDIDKKSKETHKISGKRDKPIKLEIKTLFPIILVIGVFWVSTWLFKLVTDPLLKTPLPSFILINLGYLITVILLGIYLNKMIKKYNLRFFFNKEMYIYAVNVLICGVILFFVMFNLHFPEYGSGTTVFKNEDVTLTYPDTWELEENPQERIIFLLHPSKYYLFCSLLNTTDYPSLELLREMEVNRWSEENKLKILHEEFNSDVWRLSGEIEVTNKGILHIKDLRCKSGIYGLHVLIDRDEVYMFNNIIMPVLESFECVES